MTWGLAMRVQTKDPRRRRGTVLAYVFLLIFGIIAITAMVTDAGYAILARRQMLVAVDSAALEGLRWRDTEDNPPQVRERFRREQASRRAAEVFDDDFVFDNNPDRLLQDRFNFGAGPVVQLSEGIPLQGTSFRASQKLTVGPNPAYDPVLRLNEINNVAGDMVSGTYVDPGNTGIGFPFPAAPGATVGFLGLNQPRHVELSDYTRDDFLPDPPVQGGVGAAALNPASGASAFLVRMRRTNEVFAPTSLVSSGGPPLPYLFGRGTLLDPETKARGITVRATAIATTQRAKSVGLPYSPAGLTGVTSYALARSFWDGLTSEELVDNGGSLHRFRFRFDDPKDSSRATGIELLDRVGQYIAAGSATQIGAAIGGGSSSGGSSRGYVPIYQALPTDRVIGFGRAELTPTRSLFGFQLVRITKLPSIVAPENASAVLTNPLNLVDAVELANLLAAHGSFQDPLLAPALVR